MIVFSFILLLAMVNTVFAGVFFSELESLYNLGDMINLDVNVDPVVEGRLLKVDLLCNDQSVITFNNLPDDQGNVNIKLPLNYYTIDQANGNCYFLGEYSGDTRKSAEFEISKKLTVELSSDSFFVNPGEEIIITGTAKKLNGNPVDGEVEITIPLLNLLEIPEPELDETENNETNETNETSDSLETSEDTDSEEIEDTNVEENSEETESDLEETLETEEVEDPETLETFQDYNAGIYYGKSIGGDFAVSVLLPESTPAGNYRIDVLVYEESESLRISEGVALANLEVFQIPKNVDIALNDQNFDPGSSIEIRPSLLDQTGVNIDQELSVIIKNENSERFFEKISSSQETITYQIPTNLTSSYYDIEVVSGDISGLKSFFVNQKAIASFDLANNTLTITNIGNIPYNKGIEVDLNGKTFVKTVNLELGESIKFKLTGPIGEYEIRVSDGNTEVSQSGVQLTGRSIDVNAISSSRINFSNPIAWIIVILFLLIILLFLFRNVFKKKSFAFHNVFKGIRKEKKDVVEIKEDKEKKGSIAHNKADQVLVLKGHKSNATALVLKIKNKIGKPEKDSLEKAIEHVYDKKAAVYEQGDFIFIIFSPLMTKTNKNEVEASKAAQKIINTLNEHNKKFKDKIEFGVGINSGEIINKVENKKLKFTALGNFIVVAKRLAENSNKQILVTKNSYEKGISEIKAEKKKLKEGEVYEIRSVIDNEKNKKFIKGFLERQKKEKK